MLKSLILIFLLIIKFLEIINLQCGKQDIPNCIKCGIGEESDTCIQCEDKYFLFFKNLLCLKCNDALYGNIGCEGNCDGANYEYSKNIICEENGCKEGYYNDNGICLKCSDISQNCIKCSYMIPEGSTQNEFKCLQCDYHNNYFLHNDGKCHKCLINNCYSCSSSDNKEYCFICDSGYKIKNGECTKCE